MAIETKKVVLKLEIHDDKDKQKALKRVSGLLGVESISIEMKDKKLTVTGHIDPVCIASKLRKSFRAEIVSVGPAKEPEKKKEEPKKEEPKKEDAKKEEPKKFDASELKKLYQSYPNITPNYCVCYRIVEEDPYGCVIC